MNLLCSYWLGLSLIPVLLFNSFPNDNLKIENVKLENNKKVEEIKVLPSLLSDFVLNNGKEHKLINSAIRQNFNIHLKGEIVKIDTLVIGKGSKRYLSSFLTLTRDSIVLTRITSVTTRKAYHHNLELVGELNIDINRSLDATTVTIINNNDTLELYSDFVGMDNPFIRSSGTTLNVDVFQFSCADYISEVFVFGDSYVNCASPARWPSYIYNEGYQFLCDGLPGGRSVHSYDYMLSALSMHKPKFVIWCLGMNDRCQDGLINESWKEHVMKIMEVCEENNLTLILSTIPSVPDRDNSRKNDFVRTSGHRYIDFDMAVSDGEGKWHEGLLSNDMVHPSEEGAKVLSEEFMKAFPEIKNYLR